MERPQLFSEQLVLNLLYYSLLDKYMNIQFLIITTIYIYLLAYPQEVELVANKLTNGSVINSTVDLNVTLKCMRSAENPSVVLHYTVMLITL